MLGETRAGDGKRGRYTLFAAIPLLFVAPLFHGGMGVAGHAITILSSLCFVGAALWHRKRCSIVAAFYPIRDLFLCCAILACVQLVPLPGWLLHQIAGNTMEYAQATGRTQAAGRIRLADAGFRDASKTLFIPASDAPDWRKAPSPSPTRQWHSLALLPWTTLRAWLKLFGAIVLVGAFSLAADRDKEARSLLMISVAAATTVAILRVVHAPGLGAMIGAFRNRDHLAAYCLVSLPAAIFLLPRHIRRQRRSGRYDNRNVAYVILSAVPLTMMASAILASGSRTGIALLPVVLAAALWRWSGRKRSKAIVAFLMALLAAALALQIVGGGFVLGFKELAQGHSVVYRRNLFADALRGVRCFPLFGVGLGAAPGLLEVLTPTRVKFVSYVHNDYLQWLLENGVTGTILMMLAVRHMPARLKKRSGRSPLWFALIALLLHAAVDSPLRTSSVAVAACLTAGTLLAPSTSCRKRSAASLQ